MTCPRCGFPTEVFPCTLCGLTEPDTFELQRFNVNGQNRFEFTFVVNKDVLLNNGFDLNSFEGLLSATSVGPPEKVYAFLENTKTKHLYPILDAFSRIDGKLWTLLINGRIRPYIQELWLPLFALTENA